MGFYQSCGFIEKKENFRRRDQTSHENPDYRVVRDNQKVSPKSTENKENSNIAGFRLVKNSLIRAFFRKTQFRENLKNIHKVYLAPEFSRRNGGLSSASNSHPISASSICVTVRNRAFHSFKFKDFFLCDGQCGIAHAGKEFRQFGRYKSFTKYTKKSSLR